MKKLLVILLSLFLMQNFAMARDTLQFDFPNAGWHQVESPDNVKNKKCFVPSGQSTTSYTEMLVFSERVLKNKGISPMIILHKQLGKDRNNYMDIKPEYVVHDYNNGILTWCSQLKNTCSVSRAFQGNDGVVLVQYINKMPHYSQNMFGQWTNILSHVELYDEVTKTKTQSVIEL